MSKKRKRDGTEVDAALVEIYDQLGNEDIGERIRAAHRLVTRVNRPKSTSEEDVRSIITRLFKGLCSGRKAARHGFAMALTELLSQLSKSTSPSGSMIPRAQVLDLLESATASAGTVSGQDERDHYFGRVFGAEAIIQSDILLFSSDRTQWQRLLDIVLSMAHKKPWLRQECGWVLYVFSSLAITPEKQPLVEDIVKAMKARDLIRTPEGVAIWLTVKNNYPKADLPGQCWKHRHPLAQKEINFLPQIMKDSPSARAENDHQSQGSGTWSPTLHFAWLVVLKDLWGGARPDLMSFADFWKAVVDDGLFRNTSSTERKSWGMLVWKTVLDSAPIQFLDACFTRKALRSLITELHGEDRYLRKASESVLKALKDRFRDPERGTKSDVLGRCIATLVKAIDFADFDKLTRTNTLVDLVNNADMPEQYDTFSALTDLLTEAEHEKIGTAYSRWRLILDLQSKVLSALIKSEGDMKKGLSYTRMMLGTWLMLLSGSKDVPPDTRSFLVDRIAAGFEQSLRYGGKGRAVLKDAISSCNRTTSEYTRYPEFDDEVGATVEKSFKDLKELWKREQEAGQASGAPNGDGKGARTLLDGMVLLHSVLLFETFCGDTEAVEILQDFPNDEISRLASGKLHGEGPAQLCDAMIETLLSLASRSSRLLRLVTTLIFESLASRLSEEGIGALARVLVSKENAKGQQEMFEAANGEEEEVDNDSEIDGEEIDSDVEMVNGIGPKDEASFALSEADSSSDNGDDNEQSASEADRSADDELAAFDAALASALGTRKPTEDDLDAQSSSDSDMSDSQMLALDEKLAEVFRARKATTSKKKDLKNTRENMVNFKNRGLDLVDVYLKQQTTSPVTIQLVLPLLEAIRSTQTKQLADRLTSVLRDFCQRCKGANVPAVPNEAASSIQEKLRAVHEEASLDTSNAHSAAASQASILLVKVLVRANPDGIKDAVATYANTRTKQLTDKECRVQPGFFTDWNNWCTNARNTLAT